MNLQKKLPTISIVIPCLIKSTNHLAATCRCIDTIRKCTTLEYELVVVENSEEPYLEDEADIYYHSEEDRSFAVNVNKGFELATGEYVVLVSNDVFVEDNWLEGLLKCFDKEDCGIACPLSRQFNMQRVDVIEFGFFGAIWMIKREALINIGGLDERFINSFEDSDYWIRALKAGYNLYMNRNVLVEHLVGYTAYKVEGHKQRYQKNRTLFIDKHKDCGLEVYEVLK